MRVHVYVCACLVCAQTQTLTPRVFCDWLDFRTDAHPTLDAHPTCFFLSATSVMRVSVWVAANRLCLLTHNYHLQNVQNNLLTHPNQNYYTILGDWTILREIIW